MARVISSDGSVNTAMIDPAAQTETAPEPSHDQIAQSIIIQPGVFGDNVPIPGSGFVTNADLTQSGQDLIMTTPDGIKVTIEGYFANETPPNLVAPDGKVLSPALVKSFIQVDASEYAQEQTAMNDATPVGEVMEVKGQAHVLHADGSREPLTKGSEIYEGDIVETASDGAVNITFADESSFAVSNNARMAIDEFAFDTASNEGANKFSMLRGLFVYTSGIVGREDPDDVQINTPVGSIGIRGTIIAGDIPGEGSARQAQISVVEGAIVVKNANNVEVTLSQQFETVQIDTQTGTMTNVGVLPANSMAGTFNVLRTVAPTLFTSVEEAQQEQGGNAAGSDAVGADAPADQNAAPGEDNNETQQDSAPAEGETTSDPASQGSMILAPVGERAIEAADGEGPRGTGPAQGPAASGAQVSPATLAAIAENRPALAAAIANNSAAGSTAPPPSVLQQLRESSGGNGGNGGSANGGTTGPTMNINLLKHYYRADATSASHQVDDLSFSVIQGVTYGTFLDVQRFFTSPITASPMPFEFRILNESFQQIGVSEGIVANQMMGGINLRLPTAALYTGDVLYIELKATTANFYSPTFLVEVGVWDKITHSSLNSALTTIEGPNAPTLYSIDHNGQSFSLGGGDDNLVQNSSAGTITPNIVFGGMGDDIFNIQTGKGEFFGEDGDDELSANGWAAAVNTNLDFVYLSGGDGRDLIMSEGYGVFMDGGAGQDKIVIQNNNALNQLVSAHTTNEHMVDGGTGIDKLFFDTSVAGLINLSLMSEAIRNIETVSTKGNTITNTLLLDLADIFKISGTKELYIQADSVDTIDVTYTGGGALLQQVGAFGSHSRDEWDFVGETMVTENYTVFSNGDVTLYVSSNVTNTTAITS